MDSDVTFATGIGSLASRIWVDPLLMHTMFQSGWSRLVSVCSETLLTALIA